MSVSVTTRTTFRSFLYGGAVMLLIFEVFYLIKALLTDNFVPIVPILAGIFTAAGLVLVVMAERRARTEEKKDHRRISRVAHQLESPLQALQDDLTHLMANAEKLPAEERLKLKHMETKTKVLLENIRDVFLTLQAQEGSVAQEQRVYNLCTLVGEALERQQTLAAARNVEIVHKAHCDDAPVRVDRRLFLIALTHLLENAILYTITPGLVNVAVLKGKNAARVIVQDRGVGIPKDDRVAVFQPFARGSGAEQYDPDGIGVGLTLSRLILRELGGELKYRNRPQALGSEFEIVLPLVKK